MSDASWWSGGVVDWWSQLVALYLLQAQMNRLGANLIWYGTLRYGIVR